MFLKRIKDDVYAILCYRQDPEVLVEDTLDLLEDLGKTRNIFWGNLLIYTNVPTYYLDYQIGYELEKRILEQEMIWPYSVIESDQEEDLTMYQELLKYKLSSGIYPIKFLGNERFQRIIVIRLFEPHVTSVKTANEIAEKSKKPH